MDTGEFYGPVPADKAAICSSPIGRLIELWQFKRKWLSANRDDMVKSVRKRRERQNSAVKYSFCTAVTFLKAARSSVLSLKSGVPCLSGELVFSVFSRFVRTN
jgi:hypothetical protein